MQDPLQILMHEYLWKTSMKCSEADVPLRYGILFGVWMLLLWALFALLNLTHLALWL